MEKVVINWERLDPNQLLWVLQLHQYFYPATPNKGLLLKSIIDTQFGPSVNYGIFIEKLINNPINAIKSEFKGAENFCN